MRLKYVLPALIAMNAVFVPLISAEEVKAVKEAPKECKADLKDEAVTTTHSVVIDGATINYQATAGTLTIKDDACTPKASFFYVAYTKEGVTDKAQRPITFCFNGGPGTASVWLHLGGLGPRRIAVDSLQVPLPPYSLVDNAYSILEVTDLVFIDPISTGYSKPAPGEDPKQFHGLDEDMKSIADFIRLYTTKNARWASPKFLAGESYGTTRAAGLADLLDREYYMTFNGVILISTVLNHQTLWDKQGGNDLPYALTLPSFTAAAWYHKRLPDDLQKDLKQALKESETFAYNDYTLALMQGDRMAAPEKEKIVTQIARYTGLSKAYIERSNLRVGVAFFAQELLRDELRTIGRFDSRVKGIDYDPLVSVMTWDPSFQSVFGLFTSAFNQYIRAELKWEKDDVYNIFGDVAPWNYGSKANNQYVNVGLPLSELMSRNPKMQVFVACGQFDLATPYMVTQYTFDHLGLDPSLKKNVQVQMYPAGHMMYLDKPSLIQLQKHLKAFVSQALNPG